MGSQIRTPTCDIAEIESLSAVLAKRAGVFPPIEGLIQASMVLKGAFTPIAMFRVALLTAHANKPRGRSHRKPYPQRGEA